MRRVMASFLLFIFVVSSVSFAEGKEGVDLGQVVVTGTRGERNIKDVPVRTQVISSEKIKEKGATNLYEALQGEAGIRVEEQCSYCNFSMVRLQGMGGEHSQILVDSQPIFTGLAGVYGLQQIPAAMIERIEVVKGAGSALYGSSAIAGVVNIITNRPSKEAEVMASTSFGGYNTNSYNLWASERTDNMDLLITGAKNYKGAISNIEEDKGKANYESELKNLTQRVESDNTMLGLNANWYDIVAEDDQVSFFGRSYNESRQGGDVTTYANPFAEGAENISTSRYETGFGYKRVLPNGGILKSNVAYAEHLREATNDTFVGDYLATHGDVYPGSDELEPYIALGKTLAFDGSLSWPIADKHTLLVGGQIALDELRETGKYVDVDPASATYTQTYRSESEKNASDIGVFVQGEIMILDNTELVAGVRYDSHSSKDNFGGSGDAAPLNRITTTFSEGVLSPRLALKVEASPNMAIRTSFGTGFRVPYGFSEDLHLCSGSPRVFKPSTLKPERSVSGNLSIDYAEESYSWAINVFRTNLQDTIAFEDVSPTAKILGYDYEWGNMGASYTQGIEFAADLVLSPVANVVFDLAYTDAQYDAERTDWVDNHPEYAGDSKFVSRVPQLTGGIKIGFNPDPWYFSIGADYTGSMYIDYNANDDISDPSSKIVKTDPYFIVNTKISRKLSENQTLFAGAHNLLSYVQPEKHPDDAAFMYAPFYGRIIYAGMEIRL
jgi:outer membrane receptor for ferrienterochelin and colicins